MTPTRGVLFDLDGTLYHQSRLRALMALELGSRPWLGRSPASVRRLWRVLRVFRHVREELRELGRPAESLDDLQYTVAAERAGVGANEVRQAVVEWILERPLRYMRVTRRRELEAVFGRLHREGLKIGVFSDYPVREKLQALGVAELRVRAVVCNRRGSQCLQTPCGGVPGRMRGVGAPAGAGPLRG